MADIVIFVDDPVRFSSVNYFIHLLMEEWRTAGHGLRICSETRRPPKADLAFLHIDSTVLPPGYSGLDSLYPAVVNRRAIDISKRRVSTQLVIQEDDYRGPVIVKTDANCGGVGERAQRYATPIIGRLRRKLDRKRHWSRSGILSSLNYPIYPDKEEVPAAVWSNPALVVERFIAERHNGLYALRQWVFFGERELARISYSESPIVKAGNVTASAPLDEVPESLRVLRRELGFDYGKFDYVVHDGIAVLLDANRTPSYGSRLGSKGRDYAALLASGLAAFLP